MPALTPDLSIIIVTYNSAAVIAPCLSSVAAHRSDLRVETLVVDNASADDTCEVVRQEFPWAKLITGHGNIGFAAGNNLGLAAAQGRFFLLLNPDTEIRAGALQALLTYADAHPQVGMIAPRLHNMDGSLQHSTFRFPDYRQAVYGFFEKLVPIDSVANGRYAPDAYESERPVDHILGAAIFVRRPLWEEIGGMDENYALYFEETDWCYRARQAGWELRYIPTATIMHRGAHSTSAAPERSSVLFARSQARFYRKNLGMLNYLMLKDIAFVGLTYWLARSSAALLRGRISQEQFKRRMRSYGQILLA
jgi:hypothetical protein|tara:strand:+ start:184 stop:1104 length:921 start_codon:yes stop_codon:yes gene_type:complete